MIVGNWSEIKLILEKEINKMFSFYNINELDEYEKRKILFEYLCNNLKYDYQFLEKIKEGITNKKQTSRNGYLELESVIKNKIGICNAISQYYKLLLEILGIKSYCVICSDGTIVNHQLNLVYDSNTETYSFDDITSVIVNRGTIDDYFDYDLEFANKVNQGNTKIIKDYKWFILPNEYINNLIGREEKQLNLQDLPENIISKKIYNIKK